MRSCNYKSPLVVCVCIDLVGKKISTSPQFTYDWTHCDPLITSPQPSWSHLSALPWSVELSYVFPLMWEEENVKAKRRRIKNAWCMSELEREQGWMRKNEITRDRNRRTQRCTDWCTQQSHQLHRVSSEDRNVGTLQPSPGRIPN